MAESITVGPIEACLGLAHVPVSFHCICILGLLVPIITLAPAICRLSLLVILTLCDPRDSSLPGSHVLGILQARILEWVAMPSSRDLPYPGFKSSSLLSPALAGRFFTTSATWEAHPHPLPVIPGSLCTGRCMLSTLLQQGRNCSPPPRGPSLPSGDRSLRSGWRPWPGRRVAWKCPSLWSPPCEARGAPGLREKG